MTNDKRMSDERLAIIRAHASRPSVAGDWQAIAFNECVAEIDRLRAELSTRPLPPTEGAVGDGEVAAAVAGLQMWANITALNLSKKARDRFAKAADLLTRLSAAKEEAERERDSARVEALEEAAKVADAYSEHLMTDKGIAAANLIAREIRALKQGEQ